MTMTRKEGDKLQGLLRDLTLALATVNDTADSMLVDAIYMLRRSPLCDAKTQQYLHKAEQAQARAQRGLRVILTDMRLKEQGYHFLDERGDHIKDAATLLVVAIKSRLDRLKVEESHMKAVLIAASSLLEIAWKTQERELVRLKRLTRCGLYYDLLPMSMHATYNAWHSVVDYVLNSREENKDDKVFILDDKDIIGAFDKLADVVTDMGDFNAALSTAGIDNP